MFADIRVADVAIRIHNIRRRLGEVFPDPELIDAFQFNIQQNRKRNSCLTLQEEMDQMREGTEEKSEANWALMSQSQRQTWSGCWRWGRSSGATA